MATNAYQDLLAEIREDLQQNLIKQERESRRQEEIREIKSDFFYPGHSTEEKVIKLEGLIEQLTDEVEALKKDQSKLLQAVSSGLAKMDKGAVIDHWQAKKEREQLQEMMEQMEMGGDLNGKD